jgi:tRNA nucleotidyltransferase (CCA-adding enzyme)
VCEADKRGRLGCAEAPYPEAERLRRAHAAALAVDARAVVATGITGPAVGEQLRRARIAAIAGACDGTA